MLAVTAVLTTMADIDAPSLEQLDPAEVLSYLDSMPADNNFSPAAGLMALNMAAQVCAFACA